VLPLSIGDGELCDTAVTTVSVPEMFRYWLQGGRVTVGFLGAAQIDRFGNINTTVIGDYDQPKTRLPGGGGAPEIASSCGEIFITLKQSKRAMVEKIDFFTSFGHGEGGDHRARLGITTKGPTLMVTDLAVWKAGPGHVRIHRCLVASRVSPRHGPDTECGWTVRFADKLEETPAPTEIELSTLRDLRCPHQGRPFRRQNRRSRLMAEAFICDYHPHPDWPFRRRAVLCPRR
jgi:glutaconate CoA-transferase subunit B